MNRAAGPSQPTASGPAEHSAHSQTRMRLRGSVGESEERSHRRVQQPESTDRPERAPTAPSGHDRPCDQRRQEPPTSATKQTSATEPTREIPAPAFAGFALRGDEARFGDSRQGRAGNPGDRGSFIPPTPHVDPGGAAGLRPPRRALRHVGRRLCGVSFVRIPTRRSQPGPADLAGHSASGTLERLLDARGRHLSASPPLAGRPETARYAIAVCPCQCGPREAQAKDENPVPTGATPIPVAQGTSVRGVGPRSGTTHPTSGVGHGGHGTTSRSG